MKEIKQCTRCVMDDASDRLITFDEQGRCSYCTGALKTKDSRYFPNEEGQKRLNEMIAMLKKAGKGKEYDCLMGISGGLDSAYLAYLGSVKWGLRICAVHIDDGYDTELAKQNIKNLCEKCNISLITVTPNAEQFNDLTRAYILAEVPNIATPQDNVLFACLYEQARKYKTYNFLSGGNYALECILQYDNTYTVYDMVNIKDIHKKFGRKPVDKLPMISHWRLLWDKNIHNIQTLNPLDYIDYNKERAIKELHDFCDFNYYEAKHLENTLTKVIQLYWYYHKFNVDKRKSHLSSMIVSGQMTRQQALEEMAKPIYDKEKMNEDLAKILPNLDLTREEFDKIVFRPGKSHQSYKTDWFFKKIYILLIILKKLHLIKL